MKFENSFNIKLIEYQDFWAEDDKGWKDFFYNLVKAIQFSDELSFWRQKNMKL